MDDSQALNKKQQLYAEQVSQLYKQAPVGLLSIPIVSLILSILLWTVIPHRTLITWFAAVLLVAIPRYWLVVKFSRSPQPSARAERWETYFVIGAALSGIAWGAASLVLFPVHSVAHQFLIALMLGGMVAGAAGTYSVIMRAFFAYSLPALVPLAIRFFLLADGFYIGVGSVVLVFELLMVANAKRVNTVIVSSLEMRFENQDLVEKLMTEIERADELNVKYGAEIAQRKQAEEERDRLQQQAIEVQRQALQKLSTPIIPVMEHIIVMPLVGSIDSVRARDITRALLAGIQQQQAKVAILDITGVPVVDSSVASHLDKTIQAARLKGTRTIITGISDAVAETIVDLGIDWSSIETLSDLQTGLVIALGSLGIELTSLRS